MAAGHVGADPRVRPCLPKSVLEIQDPCVRPRPPRRAHQPSLTKGFVLFSRPIVVSGPWPQMTRVSSGRV